MYSREQFTTSYINDIIYEYQSGFRAFRSTVTAQREVTYSWAYNVDREKVNAVVFLTKKRPLTQSIIKSFLSKLSNCGIYDNPHSWFDTHKSKLFSDPHTNE